MIATKQYDSDKSLLLIAGLLIGIFILGLSLIASITWGATDIAFSDIYQSFTAYDGSTSKLTIAG